MQVSELVKLAEWYRINVVEAGIEKAYINLKDIVYGNTRNGQKTPFEGERNLLMSKLRNMPINGLTLESADFLRKQGVYDLLGETGAENVENVIYKSGIDIASAAQHFQEMCDTLAKGRELFDIIEKNVGAAFDDEDDAYEQGETLVRVHFCEGSAIDNVADFKNYAALWYEIARGVTMAIDARPEDVRVLSAEKGSVIINFIVDGNTAAVFSQLVLLIMGFTLDILKIKIESKKLDDLKIRKNKEIKKLIEEEIKDKRKNCIDEICEQVAEQHNISSDGEKIVVLKNAIKNLADFLEDGGRVDFIPKEIEGVDEDGDGKLIEENKKLKAKIDNLMVDVETIRKLEGEILLLESSNEE